MHSPLRRKLAAQQQLLQQRSPTKRLQHDSVTFQPQGSPSRGRSHEGPSSHRRHSSRSRSKSPSPRKSRDPNQQPTPSRLRNVKAVSVSPVRTTSPVRDADQAHFTPERAAGKVPRAWERKPRAGIKGRIVWKRPQRAIPKGQIRAPLEDKTNIAKSDSADVARESEKPRSGTPQKIVKKAKIGDEKAAKMGALLARARDWDTSNEAENLPHKNSVLFHRMKSRESVDKESAIVVDSGDCTFGEEPTLQPAEEPASVEKSRSGCYGLADLSTSFDESSSLEESERAVEQSINLASEMGLASPLAAVAAAMDEVENSESDDEDAALEDAIEDAALVEPENPVDIVQDEIMSAAEKSNDHVAAVDAETEEPAQTSTNEEVVSSTDHVGPADQQLPGAISNTFTDVKADDSADTAEDGVTQDKHKLKDEDAVAADIDATTVDAPSAADATELADEEEPSSETSHSPSQTRDEKVDNVSESSVEEDSMGSGSSKLFSPLFFGSPTATLDFTASTLEQPQLDATTTDSPQAEPSSVNDVDDSPASTAADQSPQQATVEIVSPMEDETTANITSPLASRSLPPTPGSVTTKIALNDDESMLHAFISRTKASKAARIAKRSSDSHKQEADAIKTALASAEQAVTDSPSQGKGNQDGTARDSMEDVVASPTLTLDVAPPAAPEAPADPQQRTRRSKRKHHVEQDEAAEEEELDRPQERSGPIHFSLRRRGDVGSRISIQRSEAQELTTTTRSNTRRNKAGALPVRDVLLRLRGAEITPEEAAAMYVGAASEVAPDSTAPGSSSTVKWREELVRFFEESSDARRPLDDDVDVLSQLSGLPRAAAAASSSATGNASTDGTRPRAKRARALGAMNGTPAKSRSGKVVLGQESEDGTASTETRETTSQHKRKHASTTSNAHTDAGNTSSVSVEAERSRPHKQARRLPAPVVKVTRQNEAAAAAEAASVAADKTALPAPKTTRAAVASGASAASSLRSGLPQRRARARN